MVGYRVGVVFNPLAETKGTIFDANNIVRLISLIRLFLQVIYVKYDSLTIVVCFSIFFRYWPFL